MAHEPEDLHDIDDLLRPAERAVRDRARAFVDRAVRPVASALWERAEAGLDLFRELGALGLVGGAIAGDGCPGMSPVGAGLVSREISRGDGSLATFLAVQSGLAMPAIAQLGDASQRRQWLPELASCRRFAAFALTEPNAGSDARHLTTRATRDGRQYVLSGRKRWIGNATIADVTIVWARDESGALGAFLVEAGTPGFAAEPILGKSAMRAVPQADIALDDCRVPLTSRLPDARGFGDTIQILAGGRLGIAWAAVGHAAACYEAALAYAGERQQFGRPIAAFQLVQAKLVHMLADLIQMELLALRAARLAEEGHLTVALASLAKQSNAAHARQIAADARDVFGGNGILLANDVARHLADLEAVFTFEGTDHINTLLVGRAITGHSAFG